VAEDAILLGTDPLTNFTDLPALHQSLAPKL
jgi:hypothetical protein